MSSIAQTVASRWPNRDTVWRWHFYAGVVCIPFVIWLAITGSVFLWSPQIEAIIDAPADRLATVGPRQAPSAIAEAAVKAVPGATFRKYELPLEDDDAVRVVVRSGSGVDTRVYVDPRRLTVLKTVVDADRLGPFVQRLHGKLLIGNPGSWLVELAASWTIVMLVSGLFLWWPRGGGIAGTLYPRFSGGQRRIWRDVHAVTGFYVSLFALFLLFSGLPWANAWGNYLKSVRAVAEGRASTPDWSTGEPAKGGGDHAGHGGGGGGGGGMAGMDMAGMDMAGMDHAAMGMRAESALDALVPIATAQGFAPPVTIARAKSGDNWKIASDTANRPLRASLTVTPDGSVVRRETFGTKKPVDKVVAYGIAAHEGQLFGLANQLLNFVVALGLVLLAVSSTVLWWRRRPEGTLGAPVVRLRPPLAAGFFVLVAALGGLLPMFGVSVIVVLLLERLVLRRISGVARWLGLGNRTRTA